MPEALHHVLSRAQSRETDAVSCNVRAVAACIDALGTISKAPELAEALAHMKVLHSVLSVLQQDNVHVSIVCACMRALGLLWVNTPHMHLDESQEGGDDAVSGAGEWILGKTMEVLQSESEHRLVRIAACVCAKDLATDPTMLVALVAGGLFDKCMELLQGNCDFDEQHAASGVLEKLCRGRPYMSEWCGDAVSFMLYQHLLSDKMDAIEQSLHTMAALAQTEAGLNAIVRELPKVKKEGIAPIVNVLRTCPAVTVQIAATDALHAIAKHTRWSYVVCEMAGDKFIEVSVSCVLSSCVCDMLLHACIQCYTCMHTYMGTCLLLIQSDENADTLAGSYIYIYIYIYIYMYTSYIHV
jgi:hypothetical protein